VERDRGDEDRVLKEFARGRVLAGIGRIDHQGIGLAARPVIVEDVLFTDLEGALAGAALPDRRLIPGLPPASLVKKWNPMALLGIWCRGQAIQCELDISSVFALFKVVLPPFSSPARSN
jgi:hypothetical protein